MNRICPIWRNWAWCLVSGVVLPAAAQGYYYQRQNQQEEPQWLKYDITGGSLGVYSEMVNEKTTYSGSGSSDYNHYFVGPDLQLNSNGSIYHPNLARFSLSCDGALGQGWYGNSGGPQNTQMEWLGNGIAEMTLLGNKPYATEAEGSVTHSLSEYNFFGQTTVDTYRYGFRTGYEQDKTPVHLSYWHTLQDNSSPGQGGNYSIDSDTLNLDAENRRENGGSRFLYLLTDYGQNGAGVNTSGVNQTVAVGDTEHLGQHGNATLNSDASFSLLDSPGNSGNNLNANSGLGVTHSDTLSSGYGAGYARSTYGSDTSESYTGNASVQHQLYQSLSSGLSSYYTYADSYGPGGASSTTTYGLSLSEGYNKHLSSWAQLSITGGGGYSHSDTTQSGGAIPVNNEPHSFPSVGVPVPLSQPDVTVSSILIYKDTGHTVLYPESGNYSVTQNGQVTYITLLNTTIIPVNTTVYISYDYSSSGSGSGSYDTTDEILQARLTLWNGLLGVYGRSYSIQNSGTAGLILNSSTQYALGVNSVWRFLRVGAEYDAYDSTFSTYSTARLYQDLIFHPSRVSTLSFGFNEIWSIYSSGQGKQQLYSFINRYHRTLSSSWAFDFEDGVSLQNQAGSDQTLANFRPGLEFSKGLFSLKLSYDLEYAKYASAETYYYQTIFLRVRRSF